MIRPPAHDYRVIAASQTDLAVGPTETGIFLERLVVTVGTAATGTVALKDGNVSIPLLAANTPIGVYVLPLGIHSKVTTTPGWKITTGAGATVLAVGRFQQ